MIAEYLLKEKLKTHLLQNECRGVYFALNGKEVKIVNYDKDPDETIKELQEKINQLTLKLINK